MGYGFYFVVGYNDATPRPAGYGVGATCDQRGCDAPINRGLGCLCGTTPHGRFDDEPGCGRYFCDRHLGGVDERGRCMHGGRFAWGRVTSCMEAEVRVLGDGPGRERTDTTFCLDPADHDGPHAWERDRA